MTLICIGAFVAATFITTLVFMMNESVANGAPDNEQTRGMITSLWFMSENIAGYLGRYEMFIILYIHTFMYSYKMWKAKYFLEIFNTPTLHPLPILSTFF